VHSSSYNIDGRETLLPSVTPDGRHLQSDDDIIKEYRNTGRHLGQFADVPSAVGYARRLHDDYEAGKYDQAPARGIDPFASDPYAPEGDISFDDRIARARAARPPGRRAGMGMAASMAPQSRTIDPFYEGPAIGGAMLSDKRAKTGLASTITQQKTKNAGGY
jgi:hypothetical protein